MDDQTKNLILAVALSFLVMLVWFIVFPPPEPESDSPITEQNGSQTVPDVETLPTPGPVAQEADTEAIPVPQREVTGAEAPRITIDTPRLEGSVSLRGGRIDDLLLKDYRVSLAENAEIVTMLKPDSEVSAYYSLHGWAASTGLTREDVPGPDTVWFAQGNNQLGVDEPVRLVWENGSGLRFVREISVDRDYMFTVTQTVTNHSSDTVALAPYGIIRRHGEPEYLKNFFILHEGVVSMADGTLTETDYSDMPDFPADVRSPGVRSDLTQVAENGWIGFTDHYWMTTLIPEPGTRFRAVARYDERRDIYQVEAIQPTQTLPPGSMLTVTSRLFTGAKEWEAIRSYQNAGIKGFLDSIDWGWFFFLTKPIFWMLHEINKLIGNMGWSIICLTLIIKAILFPLAFKSYVSMAKMKELQPQMEKLKEEAGNDRSKLQQGMMNLYKKEKVNPAAGCLPILLQIPIFFSLYKVIFVTIELRHAAWFGPFRDLSAPDPTSIVNLFGWLPWPGPEPGTLLATILLGILPLLLGISMWLQQKLNPAPTDPTQAMVFAWMPWVFMFMLGSFASGLVVYWISNNVITFVQQYAIMRSQGYTPDIFGNIRAGFKRGGNAQK